ncbi:MAG: hypothetical protein EBZ59_06550 [Planctomycetia bacterium]|nr:hypothetical protein [Planctomycetia bacterium]
MPRNFARHEQFLRIHALFETLSNARQPIDDQSLLAALKERLGLATLSPRTLRRDCDFLCSCGFPVDHVPLQDGRKYGWQLAKDGIAGRKIPAEPLTLLELAAFMVARDLLGCLRGTVLWTGIESLRHRFERELPNGFRERLDDVGRVFFVHRPGGTGGDDTRPRLLSTLSATITDFQEIEVEELAEPGQHSRRHRLHPYRIVVDAPNVALLAFPADGSADSPVLIDVRRIGTITLRDATFAPRPIEPEAVGRWVEELRSDGN